MAGALALGALLEKALDAHTEIVELIDASDNHLFTNRAFRERSLDSIQGDTAFAHGLAEARAGRGWSGRVARRCSDGAELVQHAHMVPAREGDRVVAVLCVSREMSDDAMTQLLGRTDRMAAVGRLAAGVGHEINNPLSYILGNVNFLREEIARQQDQLDSAVYAELVASLDDVHHGASQVRDIVQELSSFAKIGEQGASLVEVRRTIDSILQLLHNELNHRAQVVRNFHDVPEIWCNGARLGQVLLNLLLNAVDAIPVGSAQKNTVEITVVPGAEGYIEIRIRDTGQGIDESTLPHIFDPFYSTKPVGSGTGLGLSTSHAIVADMNGRIEIDSAVNRGTTVTVSLPVTLQPEREPAKRTRRVSARGSRGQILVVDDQIGVLRTINRILAAHDVSTCSSGATALKLLFERPFDIVFCDLMMPDLTGEELYMQVVGRNAKLAQRFVFITGGAFTDSAARFLKKVDNQVIEKPFDPGTLRGLVERMLT